MANDPITGIAGAIEQGFKLIAQVLSGSEKRRMRKAIEYGEQYILKTKELRVFRKELEDIEEKFFKYNN